MIITELQNDNIYNIIEFLSSVNDLIALSQINKYMRDLIDNSYYEYMGNLLYSHEFWIKAKSRHPQISKPLKNMKLELLRLENFNNKIAEQGIKWTREDFYNFWNLSEISHKIKKIKL